jgi:anti-anti-sigma factor
VRVPEPRGRLRSDGPTMREIAPRVYVVVVPDTFLPEIAEHFEQALLAIIDAEPRFLILDASGIADIEPCGVGVLVTAAERAGQSDIGLCLVIDSDPVRQRLASSDVLDLFETALTVEQAAGMLG